MGQLDRARIYQKIISYVFCEIFRAKSDFKPKKFSDIFMSAPYYDQLY